MNTFKYTPEGWSNEVVRLNQKEEINEYIKSKKILQGIVESCDDLCNLHIQLGQGVEGIIPPYEVEGINIDKRGLPKKNLCTGKVHKYIQFRIKEINEENIPILSRKEIQQEALEEAVNSLNVGEKVDGIVKNITTYGAFIEIGAGVVGLAHIEDLSVARIKTPFERLKIGQKVKDVIKYIDRENKKITLSYKEQFGTWKENADKFKSGEIVRGIIRETEKNHNGIFIELSPNLVGMAEYKEGLTYGQNIPVFIKKIDYDRKKVKLVII